MALLVQGNFISESPSFRLNSHMLGRDDAVGGVMTKEPSITPLVGTNSCGDNIDCAAASTDGCAFTSNGKIYIAHCEMDFYGNDFAVTQTNEFTACVTYCANTGGCQGVSWVSGTCYLKSCIAQGSYNPAVKGMSSMSWSVLDEKLTRVSCICSAMNLASSTPVQSKYVSV
jgi:hypothetical protein